VIIPDTEESLTKGQFQEIIEMTLPKQPVEGGKVNLSVTKTFTIGQLAEVVSNITGQRCTSAMIYNYERLGLILPPERTQGGFRLFKYEDITRIARIKRWQDEGLSLAEIKNRLDQPGEIEESQAQIVDLPVDRRSQILEAAGRIFPQKGYRETTIQDIAQEVGFSNSAIYQYFQNKEELFLALTESLSFMDVMEDITSPLDQKADVTLGEIRQALIEVAEAFLDTHHPNAEVIRLFISEVRLFPEIGIRYCERLVAPLEAQLERYLEYQIERGIFRPVEVKLAVHAFYGIFLNFVVTQDLLGGKDCLYFPLQESVPKMVDLFLGGILNSEQRSS
jgi:AcrR family transcriptional regulator